MSQQEIEEYKKEKERELTQGFGRWNWFSIIEKLAQGDITKFDDIYKQNYILALNLLAYWKEKDIEEEKIKKAQQQQMKNFR